MDPMTVMTLVFSLVVLIFALMFAALIVYVPYKIVMRILRGLTTSTRKTIAVVIPAKK